MASIYFKKNFHGFAESHDAQDDSVSYDEIDLSVGDSIDLLPGDKVETVKGGIVIFFNSYRDTNGAVLSLPKGVYEIRG